MENSKKNTKNSISNENFIKLMEKAHQRFESLRDYQQRYSLNQQLTNRWKNESK